MDDNTMNINILSDQQVETLRSAISQAGNIVICVHKSPDGDAIGSALGWAEFLRTMGKNPMITAPDAFPDFLKWLPFSDRVVRYDKKRGWRRH